jgi:hypothetical protein
MRRAELRRAAVRRRWAHGTTTSIKSREWSNGELRPVQGPVPRTKPRANEKLWELFKGHDIYACELKYHGECGVEAQIFKNAELLVGYRHQTRALAVQWVEQERQDIEKGST